MKKYKLFLFKLFHPFFKYSQRQTFWSCIEKSDSGVFHICAFSILPSGDGVEFSFEELEEKCNEVTMEM